MERRLAAILAIDMVGYSRLMAADEAGTVKRFKQHFNEVFEPRLAEYGGRIVKMTGDGLLAEFPSVVDAVRCGVMIQLSAAKLESSIQTDTRIFYRIGINLGDIIFEKEDIFGDRVNVAARLEKLAEPGGICVSRTVVDHVRGNISSTFEDLGELQVKNIPEPLHVFRVVMVPEEQGSLTAQTSPSRRMLKLAWIGTLLGLVLIVVVILAWQPWRPPEIEPASVKDLAFPLPDKPSLAVLPFANLSGSVDQEYLADGIVSDLITDLSKFKNLFVISANSTFAYKGTPVKVQKVAEDLGVRYVLEGSIQQVGDTVRINTQLIDAISGYHLWADRYVGEISDLLEVQNRVVKNVVTELAVNLEAGEGQKLDNDHGLSQQSSQLFSRARSILPSYFIDKSDLSNAREMFEDLADREPDFSGGYAGLSRTYSLGVLRGTSKSPDLDAETALTFAEKARDIDPQDEFTRLALADAQFVIGRRDDAIATLQQIMQASPSNADAHGRLGLLLTWIGRPDEAIDHIKSAIRLNPYVGSPYLNYLGLAEFTAGRYNSAAAAFEENAANGGPIDDAGLAVMTATYHELGRNKEEKATLARLFNRYPGIHLRSFWLIQNYARQEDRKRVEDTLLRANIPFDRPYTR